MTGAGSNRRFIASSDVGLLLAELAGRGEVWAPGKQAVPGAAVLFDRWREGIELDLENITHLSAKEQLLPATEKMFSFGYGRGDAGEFLRIGDAGGANGVEPGGADDTGQSGEAVSMFLVGARVCDARAVHILDTLFGPDAESAYADASYRRRRECLTIISVACTTADPACFCGSFTGPGDTTGSDVMLYPVDGGLLAEAVTEKGAELVASSLFEDSTLEPPALAETAKVDVASLRDKLPQIFEQLDFWQRAAANCLSCGYCTYACPTCHCFDIFDEMSSDREGARLRGWDACMFHLYTQEASGHNPRPTSAHRYRNRINHKFSYFPANRSEFLCTGCGRCIRGCPAGIDIREILTAAKEL